MVYFKFIAGIVVLVIFGWLLVKNRDKRGILFSLLQIDILLGLLAGLYLVVTAMVALA